MVKSEPKKKPQPGGFFQKFFRKPEKSEKEQRLTVQRSIPYLEMGRDGICRVEEHLYSKTVRFYDINYQLAQNEDKNTIFESWCDFLNYFDASIRFQLSFINHKSDMSEYNKVIQIDPQHDQFDDVRMALSTARPTSGHSDRTAAIVCWHHWKFWMRRRISNGWPIFLQSAPSVSRNPLPRWTRQAKPWHSPSERKQG